MVEHEVHDQQMWREELAAERARVDQLHGAEGLPAVDWTSDTGVLNWKLLHRVYTSFLDSVHGSDRAVSSLSKSTEQNELSRAHAKNATRRQVSAIHRMYVAAALHLGKPSLVRDVFYKNRAVLCSVALKTCLDAGGQLADLVLVNAVYEQYIRNLEDYREAEAAWSDALEVSDRKRSQKRRGSANGSLATRPAAAGSGSASGWMVDDGGGGGKAVAEGEPVHRQTSAHHAALGKDGDDMDVDGLSLDFLRHCTCALFRCHKYSDAMSMVQQARGLISMKKQRAMEADEQHEAALDSQLTERRRTPLPDPLLMAPQRTSIDEILTDARAFFRDVLAAANMTGRADLSEQVYSMARDDGSGTTASMLAFLIKSAVQNNDERQVECARQLLSLPENQSCWQGSDLVISLLEWHVKLPDSKKRDRELARLLETSLKKIKALEQRVSVIEAAMVLGAQAGNLSLVRKAFDMHRTLPGCSVHLGGYTLAMDCFAELGQAKELVDSWRSGTATLGQLVSKQVSVVLNSPGEMGRVADSRHGVRGALRSVPYDLAEDDFEFRWQPVKEGQQHEGKETHAAADGALGQDRRPFKARFELVIPMKAHLMAGIVKIVAARMAPLQGHRTQPAAVKSVREQGSAGAKRLLAEVQELYNVALRQLDPKQASIAWGIFCYMRQHGWMETSHPLSRELLTLLVQGCHECGMERMVKLIARKALYSGVKPMGGGEIVYDESLRRTVSEVSTIRAWGQRVRALRKLQALEAQKGSLHDKKKRRDLGRIIGPERAVFEAAMTNAFGLGGPPIKQADRQRRTRELAPLVHALVDPRRADLPEFPRARSLMWCSAMQHRGFIDEFYYQDVREYMEAMLEAAGCSESCAAMGQGGEQEEAKKNGDATRSQKRKKAWHMEEGSGGAEEVEDGPTGAGAGEEGGLRFALSSHMCSTLIRLLHRVGANELCEVVFKHIWTLRRVRAPDCFKAYMHSAWNRFWVCEAVYDEAVQNRCDNSQMRSAFLAICLWNGKVNTATALLEQLRSDTVSGGWAFSMMLEAAQRAKDLDLVARLHQEAFERGLAEPKLHFIAIKAYGSLGLGERVLAVYERLLGGRAQAGTGGLYATPAQAGTVGAVVAGESTDADEQSSSGQAQEQGQGQGQGEQHVGSDVQLLKESSSPDADADKGLAPSPLDWKAPAKDRPSSFMPGVARDGLTPAQQSLREQLSVEVIRALCVADQSRPPAWSVYRRAARAVFYRLWSDGLAREAAFTASIKLAQVAGDLDFAHTVYRHALAAGECSSDVVIYMIAVAGLKKDAELAYRTFQHACGAGLAEYGAMLAFKTAVRASVDSEQAAVLIGRAQQDYDRRSKPSGDRDERTGS